MTSGRKPRRFGHGRGAVAITSAQPALEANQHGHREIRWSKHFKAYCVCGRKMLPTTPDDVRAGVQPRCPRCPS